MGWIGSRRDGQWIGSRRDGQWIGRCVFDLSRFCIPLAYMLD